MQGFAYDSTLHLASLPLGSARLHTHHYSTHGPGAPKDMLVTFVIGADNGSATKNPLS